MYTIEGADAKFLPDEKTLSYITSDAAVHLFDTSNFKEVDVFGGVLTHHPVINYQISPDGNNLLTESIGDTIHLWNINSGMLLGTETSHNTRGITRVSLTLDNNKVVTYNEDGFTDVVNIWDIKNDERSLEYYGVYLYKLSANTDKLLVDVFYPDYHFEVWNIQNNILECTIPGTSGDISPDNKEFVVSTEEGIHFWDLEICEKKNKTVENVNRYIPHLRYSPDGKTITGPIHSNTFFWDSASGEKIGEVEGHYGNFSLKYFTSPYSPDEKSFVTIFNDNIFIWDLDTLAKIQTLNQKNIEFFTFSPDDKLLVSCDFQKTILWDVMTGKRLQEFEVSSGYAFSFSPYGNLFAIIIDDTIQLWDNSKNTKINTLTPDYESTSLTFSPDGKTLAIGSADGIIHFWGIP